MCWIPCISRLEQWYLREMVIMVEDVHKVGEEVISEAVEVEEMLMQAGVTCNQVGKWFVKMIGLSVMPFRAKPRLRRLMQ